MNRIGICAIATFLAMDPVLTVRADGLPVKPGQNVPFCVHYYDMVPHLNTIIVLRDPEAGKKNFHGKCGVIDGSLVDSVLEESNDSKFDTKFGRMIHVMIHTETSLDQTLDVHIVAIE